MPDKHGERHDEIDKELRAIRKILNIGARQLVDQGEKINILIDAQMKLAEAQARTQSRIDELAEAQVRTEASLKAFIDSMRRGGNGR